VTGRNSRLALLRVREEFYASPAHATCASRRHSDAGTPGWRTRYSGLVGDSGAPTSGSAGIVGGSGAVAGSCSGIVPGSAGMGSSGVGRSGVVPGSWLAISSLLRLGRPVYPARNPQNVGLRLTAEQPGYDGA
jgi:hypothetical protein